MRESVVISQPMLRLVPAGRFETQDITTQPQINHYVSEGWICDVDTFFSFMNTQTMTNLWTITAVLVSTVNSCPTFQRFIIDCLSKQRIEKLES